MKIVGVGAGPGLLTKEAIFAIENARIIFGSKRAIELAREHIKCKAEILTDYSLESLPENAVVLSTGDPMLSGLGKHARKGDEIISGISSLQIACAKLCLEIDRTAVITAHSRDIKEVKQQLLVELKNEKNIFILPDQSFGINEIGIFMKNNGFQRNLIICEKLGYPDERIAIGTTDKPPLAISDMYSVVVNGCIEPLSSIP